MMPTIRLALLGAALVLRLATAPALAQPLLPGQFQAYAEDGRTEIHQSPQALARFDALFAAAGDVTALPDDTLRGLAADAAAANFYYGGTRAEAHGTVFAELVRRDLATGLQIEDYHRSLIAARRWQDASTLARQHPDVPLEALPAHFDGDNGNTTGAHYWRFDASEDRLTREPLATGGVTLVVVSHPGCRYSRAAMAAIENDPALDQALPARRVFVAPAFASLDLEHIGGWNAAHPRARHVLADRPQAWSFVRKWNTPQFFFLVDDALVATVEGWPEEGRVDELLAASRKVER